MKLTNLQWFEIEKLWCANEPNTKIAKQYNITEGSIRSKAITEKWQRDEKDTKERKFNPLENKINKTQKKIAIVTDNFYNQQIASIVEKTIIENESEPSKDKSETLSAGAKSNIFDEIISHTLRLQKELLLSVKRSLRDGTYQPHQVASILRMQGLSVSDIVNMLELKGKLNTKDANERPVIQLNLACFDKDKNEQN